MTEEPKLDGKEEPKAKPAEPSNADFRSTALFNTMTEKNKALQAQLQEIKDKEAAEKAEAKRKTLESKGEYDTLIEQLKAEKEANALQHARDLAQVELKAALTAAGMHDPFALNGATSQYTGDKTGVAEYVTQLQESHPTSFTGAKEGGGLAAAIVGDPAGRASSEIDWDAVKAESLGTDKSKAAAAARQIENYAKNNGWKLPPYKQKE